MRTATGRAFARAALAGNPSDGFGGQTLAVPIRELRAEVVLAVGAPDDPGVDPDALRLADAARRRLGGPVAGVVSVQTTIPREVGLGGSSAIVTATLRALLELEGRELAPLELARVALAAEVEELGIAAGPQDRVVQAFETLVAMDFGCEPFACAALDPGLLPPLYLAWHPDAGAHSGHVHGDLRARHDAGEPAVRAAMGRLATLGADAADALRAGDHAAFGACVDGSFDARRALIPDLDERHIAMIEAARAAGASANYAGSGGAIVGVLPPDAAALRAALEGIGCVVLEPRVR